MRNAVKTALFVSVFSPALITLGVARLLPPAPDRWSGLWYIAAGLFSCLSVVYIVGALRWYGELFVVQVKKVESYDALMLGIVTTYLIPFFLKSEDLTIYGIMTLVGLVGTFSWLGDATIPSPLMRLFKFRFYKIETGNGMVYALVTRREVLDPAQVRSVKRVSGSMLLEVSE